MAKWCFLGLFFEVLVLLWFVFGVSGKVARSAKNACLFSQYCWAFVGWLILVYFGFGRFRCFCVSCFCFYFACSFCFCLCFALFLFCCWIVFGVGSCFAFSVFLAIGFYFRCCSLGSGEVAQRATSLGPKPSLFFLFFCFCYFCFCFFVLGEGLRVR